MWNSIYYILVIGEGNISYFGIIVFRKISIIIIVNLKC